MKDMLEEKYISYDFIDGSVLTQPIFQIITYEKKNFYVLQSSHYEYCTQWFEYMYRH